MVFLHISIVARIVDAVPAEIQQEDGDPGRIRFSTEFRSRDADEDREAMQSARHLQFPLRHRGHREGRSRRRLEAVREFNDVHLAQCVNYLKATGLKVCLLINFGGPRVEIKRVVN